MDAVTIPYFFARTLYRSLRHPTLFKDIETFIMFIGYPRSGHTLVGFLLDAHPNIVVAAKLNGLRFLKYGFTLQQIFHLLVLNSRRVAKYGRGGNRYAYDVPNQWQGRFEKLKVIGDSLGLSRVRNNPAMLESLQRSLNGVNLKLVHCIRNPYDNISTMKIRSRRPLPEVIETYFSMCEVVEKIKNQLGHKAVHELTHEEVVAKPRAVLEELCKFLGLSGDDKYFEDCASIIYKSPHKSRREIEWSRELIDSVERRMERFSFLRGYSFDD